MNLLERVSFLVDKVLLSPKRIEPLITFRILFGGLMAYGALRFMFRGWVEKLYVEPRFFFKFYGFYWVEDLGHVGSYVLYAVIAVSAFFVMLGLFYRYAAAMFFLSFTYSELIDATNYLNHYYLVCLLAFLLIFLPANKAFSLDVWLNRVKAVNLVPAWTINVIILQLTIVYTCAGLAKLNPDWLLDGMPLKVWLPEHKDFPLLGNVFSHTWSPYIFSWFGAFYDLSVAYFMMWRKSRPIAYVAVVVFHVLTKILFNIGLFPFIMIFSTLVFFSADFHAKLLGWIGYKKDNLNLEGLKYNMRFLRPLLIVFFALQLALPFRYLLYPGNILWTEEGYRFSWRVMLVEKVGYATFYVRDKVSGRKSEVMNRDYLTSFQEKQMSIQPDFILQYACFLADVYSEKYGIDNPEVRVDSFVALNGRPSQRFIDPNVNLTKVSDSFAHKSWVLPFEDN